MRAFNLGFLAIGLSMTACGSLNVDALGNTPEQKGDLPAATKKKDQDSKAEHSKLSAHQKALMGGVYEVSGRDIKGEGYDSVSVSAFEFFADNTFVMFTRGTFLNLPNTPIVLLMKGTYEVKGDAVILRAWSESSCPESLRRAARPNANPDTNMRVSLDGTLIDVDGTTLNKKAGVTMKSPAFKAATVSRLTCGPSQTPSWPASL